MNAVLIVARAIVRRGWPSLLVLSTLLALAAGIVLATAAGAQRTATAFDRFLEHVGASDVAIGQDAALRPHVLREMASLPGVEASGTVAFLVMAPEGVPQIGANAVAAADADWGVELDRPFIVAGRVPVARTEVALNEAFVERLGVSVGDRVTFRSFARSQLADLFSGEAKGPLGPRVTSTLVGILRNPRDLALRSDAQLEALFPLAFYERYRDEILVFGPSLMLRLEDGEAGIPAFEEAVAAAGERLTGSVQQEVGPIAQDEDIRVTNSRALYRPVEDAGRIQAIAIAVFSAIVAIAAVIAIGLALARQAAGVSSEAPRFAAVGMRRRQLALATVLPAAITILAATLVGGVLAVLGSRAFPFGAMRSVEPDPGIRVDAAVLVATGSAFAAALIGVVVVAVLRALARNATPAPARRSLLALAAASAGASPAATVGIRFAREPGRGRTTVPVRSVTLGSAAGILALVAAVTVAANLHRLVSEPSLFGWNWDAVVTGGDDPATMPRTAARLSDIDGIEGFAAVLLADVEAGGDVLQGAFVEEPDGWPSFTMIAGHSPRAADEVALGTGTMRRLDVAIGDEIAIRGTRPGTFTIVGRVALPVFDEGRLDDGAVFTDGARDRLEPVPDYPVFPVRFADDPDAVRARLIAEFGESNVSGVTRPGEVENLARILGVPWLLAGALAVLTVATIAHAIVLTTRRRSRDLAILKTLGFLRRQVRSAVAWQAGAFVVLACVMAVPAGIAAGRWAWVQLADRIGVAASPSVPLALVVVGVPLALGAIAVLAAAGPGRYAARTQPALVLRSE